MLTPYADPGRTNFLWTVINLANDILGPGMVSLPYYVASLGVYFTPIAFLVVGLFNIYTLNSIFYLARKFKKRSYPDLCQFALGTPGSVLALALIFIFNFGGFVGSLQIIGSNVPQLITHFAGRESIWWSRNYFLLFTCLALLPLSFFRTLSDITFSSIGSTLCLASISGLLFFDLFSNLSDLPSTSDLVYIDFKANFFSAFGGISYLFACHDLSFNAFDEFRGPNRKRWRYVVALTMFTTQILFFMFGFSGFVRFGKNVQENVLEEYSESQFLGIAGRSIICLTILFSVPYYIFMPRISISGILLLLFGPKANSRWAHILSTLIVMGLALLTAEMVKSLGTVYELIGGASGIGLALILPPVLFLKLEKGNIFNSPKKLLNLVILIYGIISLVVVVISSVLQTA